MRFLCVVRLGCLLLLAGGACAHAPTLPENGGPLQTGTWSGEHAVLTARDTGVHIEFNCASGDVSQPIALDSRDEFSVDGTLIKEVGPARIQLLAHYNGRVEKQMMTLTVTIPTSNETMGPFTLALGGKSNLAKCA